MTVIVTVAGVCVAVAGVIVAVTVVELDRLGRRGVPRRVRRLPERVRDDRQAPDHQETDRPLEDRLGAHPFLLHLAAIPGGMRDGRGGCYHSAGFPLPRRSRPTTAVAQSQTAS